jgi:hypothetical protein
MANGRRARVATAPGWEVPPSTACVVGPEQREKARVNQEQPHNVSASGDGARSEQDGDPRAASGRDPRGVLDGLRDALAAPLRWLREMFARGSRWLRRRLRFAPSWIREAFRRLTSGRGFGFWWLVVTLLLAGIVGLLVAALLTPVMGLLAGLAVAIWFLIRKGAGNTRDDRGSAATA